MKSKLLLTLVAISILLVSSESQAGSSLNWDLSTRGEQFYYTTNLQLGSYISFYRQTNSTGCRFKANLYRHLLRFSIRLDDSHLKSPRFSFGHGFSLLHSTLNWQPASKQYSFSMMIRKNSNSISFMMSPRSKLLSGRLSTHLLGFRISADVRTKIVENWKLEMDSWQVSIGDRYSLDFLDDLWDDLWQKPVRDEGEWEQ